MAERLYPARKLCKKCGKKLDRVVLEGLYCSYRCGGFPEPYKAIGDAPRYCKLPRDGAFVWKQRYRAVEEVPLRLREDPATNIYTCSHCRFFHVGHSRPTGEETSRLVADVETLASFLLRTREQKKLDRKDVAARLKVRPIRIKEVEEGLPGASLDVVFKLLRFYRVKMNLLFPK